MLVCTVGSTRHWLRFGCTYLDTHAVIVSSFVSWLCATGTRVIRLSVTDLVQVRRENSLSSQRASIWHRVRWSPRAAARRLAGGRRRAGRRLAAGWGRAAHPPPPRLAAARRVSGLDSGGAFTRQEVQLHSTRAAKRRLPRTSSTTATTTSRVLRLYSSPSGSAAWGLLREACVPPDSRDDQDHGGPRGTGS